MATYRKNTYIRDTYDLFESVSRPNRSFNALQIFNALDALDLAPGGKSPENTIQNYMQRFVTENPGVIRRKKVDGVFQYKKMFKDDTELIKYQKNAIQMEKRDVNFYRRRWKEEKAKRKTIEQDNKEKDEKIKAMQKVIDDLRFRNNILNQHSLTIHNDLVGIVKNFKSAKN